LHFILKTIFPGCTLQPASCVKNVGWFRTFIKDQYFSKQTLYTHLLSPF
jgi:hypothetical protein